MRKKFNGVRFGECINQSTNPRRPIQRPGNIVYRLSWTWFALWLGALSCWNYVRILVAKSTFSNNAGSILNNIIIHGSC